MGSLRTLHKHSNNMACFQPFRFPWHKTVYPGDPVDRYRCRILPEWILHTWVQSDIPMSFRIVDGSSTKGVTVFVFDYIDRDDGCFSWYWTISIPAFKTMIDLNKFDEEIFKGIQMRGFFGIQEAYPDFPYSWIHTYDSDYTIPKIGERR